MRQVINKINAVDFNNLAERQHFGDIYEQILTDLQSAARGRVLPHPRRHGFMVDRIDQGPRYPLRYRLPVQAVSHLRYPPHA